MSDMDAVASKGGRKNRQSSPATDFIGNGELLNLPDKLACLVSYGEMFILVSGGPGQGKSLAKTQMLEQLADFLPVVELTVQQRSLTELLAELLAGFSLNAAQGDSNAGLAHLRRFTRDLGNSSRKAVVVVDDAHCLTNAALKTLLDLVEKAGLGLVLFAEPSIDRRGALKAAAARIYRCPLERLDQAQARSYLRRTQPMLSEDLNQTQLDNILVDSGGVKGEIDRRVEDILHEPRPARGLPLIHVSMLLALIVIVGTALWFEAGSESSVTSQPLALDVSTADTATSAERASLSVAPQPLPAPKLSTDAADLPTLDSDANTVTKTPQVPAMRALPGQSRNLSMAVILPTGASAETAAETRLQAVARTPAKTTITTRDIPEQTASQAPLIAAPEPSLRALNAGTADWIYSAGPGEYTLQLMGSYSLEGIEAFIATTPDPERFAYFVTRRGSDIWYVLTAGRYPSREAAIAAINVLPLNLRDAKPWARSVESIRASVGF